MADTGAGEFEPIRRYFWGLGGGDGALLLGIGDDAALLQVPPGEVLVTSVDTTVAGVHYPEETFPEVVGYRALAVAASDLAAMGATPLACTLALTLPAAEALWLQAFSEGVAQAVRRFGLPLAGGDTTRGPATVVSVSVFGACPPGAALTRAGASSGDAVYVSGTLGDSAAALAFLEGAWQPPPAQAEALLERFHRPEPRLALGKSLRGRASACIDVSDGLIADLGHLCAASGVGMALEGAALPLSPALRAAGERARAWVLGGGDDYELAFTLPPTREAPRGCTRIGTVTEVPGLRIDGEAVAQAGYSHF